LRRRPTHTDCHPEGRAVCVPKHLSQSAQQDSNLLKTRSVLSLILLAGAALACGPVYVPSFPRPVLRVCPMVRLLPLIQFNPTEPSRRLPQRSDPGCGELLERGYTRRAFRILLERRLFNNLWICYRRQWNTNGAARHGSWRKSRWRNEPGYRRRWRWQVPVHTKWQGRNGGNLLHSERRHARPCRFRRRDYSKLRLQWNCGRIDIRLTNLSLGIPAPSRSVILRAAPFAARRISARPRCTISTPNPARYLRRFLAHRNSRF
jgi:hypothetical protein